MDQTLIEPEFWIRAIRRESGCNIQFKPESVEKISRHFSRIITRCKPVSCDAISDIRFIFQQDSDDDALEDLRYLFGDVACDSIDYIHELNMRELHASQVIEKLLSPLDKRIVRRLMFGD